MIITRTLTRCCDYTRTCAYIDALSRDRFKLLLYTQRHVYVDFFFIHVTSQVIAFQLVLQQYITQYMYADRV